MFERDDVFSRVSLEMMPNLRDEDVEVDEVVLLFRRAENEEEVGSDPGLNEGGDDGLLFDDDVFPPLLLLRRADRSAL